VTRRRTLLAVAACVLATLLVGVVGYLAIVGPQRHDGDRLASRIAAAQSQLAAAEAARTRTSGGDAAAVYRLARAMPLADDEPGILLDLGRLAAAGGVQLVSVKPAPKVVLADGSSAVPLTVVVDGRYLQVTAFLRELRLQVRSGRSGVVAAGRLFVVDRADVSLDTGNSVAATLQLNAFTYAAPATTTVTAPTAPAAGAVAAGSTP
jgi:Tfp pilus assembly protein PilO